MSMIAMACDSRGSDIWNILGYEEVPRLAQQCSRLKGQIANAYSTIVPAHNRASNDALGGECCKVLPLCYSTDHFHTRLTGNGQTIDYMLSRTKVDYSAYTTSSSTSMIFALISKNFVLSTESEAIFCRLLSFTASKRNTETSGAR